MVTMNISLTPEMKAWVEAQSASGRYSNNSEVMRDLIRRQLTNEEKIANMQKLVDEARAGEFSKLDKDEIWNEAMRRFDGTEQAKAF